MATGDALGATLEFESPGFFTPIYDMVGGGSFGLAPGQWFDPMDQMAGYVRWWGEGYLSYIFSSRRHSFCAIAELRKTA